ncbi:MAG: hypothetical protein FVQ85_00990 [Planctomycetes bacterium]|nr:hypothetical protein [Planctomycetota bacterium]
MMPGNLFRLELAAAFADRRRIVLRVSVSVLLGLPFILVDMPPNVKAAGIVMVILFTSFFGAAVGHAKLRADLRFDRLALLPTRRALLWLDLILASALARLGPTSIVLAGFLLINGQSLTARAVVVLFGLFCSSVVLLTLLGIGIGRIARNNGEVHLFGALAAGILACISGVTPLPRRLSWLAATMAWNPVARLHAMLTKLATGSIAVGLTELTFVSLMLGGIAVIVVLRWISGGAFKTKGVDARDIVVDNGAPLEA